MKKFYKILITAAGIIAAAECANRIIFKLAGKKIKSKFREGIYNWKFGKIRYITAGSGKPLLLIHDMCPGGNLGEWQESISALSKKYRVYAIDLIGFGFSEKPNITYSSYMFVSLINDFIKNVVKEKTSVISRGSSAQYVIAAYLLNSELYKKLLFIAPEGFGNRKKPNGKKAPFFRRLFEIPIAGTFFYNILTSKFMLRRKLNIFGFSDETFIKGKFINESYQSAHYGGLNNIIPFAAQKSGYLDTDVKRLFPHIDIPVHVIWGEKNRKNLVSNFKIMEQLNPYTSLTVFLDTKEFPHIENLKGFIKECESFIN